MVIIYKISCHITVYLFNLTVPGTNPDIKKTNLTSYQILYNLSFRKPVIFPNLNKRNPLFYGQKCLFLMISLVFVKLTVKINPIKLKTHFQIRKINIYLFSLKSRPVIKYDIACIY